MFILNFKNQTVFRGHASQAFIALDAESKKPVNASFSLVGNTSCNTRTNGNRVMVAADEKADTLTFIAEYQGEVQKAELHVADASGKTTEFDDSNVIVTFGVTSDTHVSGSWNQKRSTEKWVHCIKGLQEAAGRNADGTTKLDLFTCAGDFVDAVNSFGNVNGNVEGNGHKGAQNYREVSFLRSGLEGRETNHAETIEDGKPNVNTDFGSGLKKGVGFFYCLGNHDESGRGETRENEKYTKVYTARYFVAVMCGWEYDSKKGDGTPDFCDSTYISYAEDLAAIHTACECKKDALIAEFTKKHGVDGKYAYGRFCDIYGNDTDFSCEDHGLFFGNRHTVVNGIHFIAIEVSQCKESAEFLDKWCSVSVAENEKKPIIVYTHEKVYHTIDSSVPKSDCIQEYMSVPGHTTLLDTLAKYPQIFLWTGHTHSVLTNANAIMSDCGFTSVEGSVIAYLSCEGVIGRGETPAGNYCRKEEHDAGPCCLVKIDKNYNVKIEKLDMHRSYTNGNDAVYFGEPWVITDISANGEHLLKYNAERGFDSNNNAPKFCENAKVTVTKGDDGKLYVNFPAAHEDGSDVVKYYKVELVNKADENDRPWQYATSFAFRYSNEAELNTVYPSYSIVFPAEKEPRVSENLQHCVDLSTPRDDAEYIAYVTAYDSWHKASTTLISE